MRGCSIDDICVRSDWGESRRSAGIFKGTTGHLDPWFAAVRHRHRPNRGTTTFPKARRIRSVASRGESGESVNVALRMCLVYMMKLSYGPRVIHTCRNAEIPCSLRRPSPRRSRLWRARGNEYRTYGNDAGSAATKRLSTRSLRGASLRMIGDGDIAAARHRPYQKAYRSFMGWRSPEAVCGGRIKCLRGEIQCKMVAARLEGTKQLLSDGLKRIGAHFRLTIGQRREHIFCATESATAPFCAA